MKLAIYSNLQKHFTFVSKLAIFLTNPLSFDCTHVHTDTAYNANNNSTQHFSRFPSVPFDILNLVVLSETFTFLLPQHAQATFEAFFRPQR